jgi:hypothetical protein
MSHRSFQVTLSTALAPAGTLTVGYPPGTSRTTYLTGTQHVLTALGGVYRAPAQITVALNAASAVITYNGTTTIPAGTTVSVQLDAGGPRIAGDGPVPFPRVSRIAGGLVRLKLGNPVAGAANAIFLSAAINTGTPVTVFTGATAGTLDVPRNVVAAWTNTAVMTVTGLDEYGRVMVESSASGTSMTGVKAFARITSIAVSANVTGCTVGTGNVLGLPLFIPGTASILRESQDMQAPTAGTVVAGLSVGTRSTATTADVRGTYTPNATPNGTIAFALIAALENPEHVGNPQFAG